MEAFITRINLHLAKQNFCTRDKIFPVTKPFFALDILNKTIDDTEKVSLLKDLAFLVEFQLAWKRLRATTCPSH